MSADTFLHGCLLAGAVLIGLAMLLGLVRLLVGPRAQDRVLAFDAIYANAVLLLLVMCLQAGDRRYFEAALVMAVFGFAGTAALAKFLMRGEVIE